MNVSVINAIQAAEYFESHKTEEQTVIPGLMVTRLATPGGAILLVQGSADEFIKITP